MSTTTESKPKPSSPILSWKNKLLLSTYSFAVDLSRRPNLTVNRRLMSLFDPKSPPTSSPTVSVSDVNFHNNLWLRLYTPITSEYSSKLPLIVYFHGGGFAFMAANSKIYDDFCRRLAVELPAVVASVNYRLSPEHRFPAQHDDGIAALRFIAGGGDFLPEAADRNNCFIAGDSAGGNIAHHVALRACNNEEDDLRSIEIRGVIAIQPFFGGEERTESEIRVVGVPLVKQERTDWMWKAWLPDGSDRDHPAVNVFGMDISGMRFPGAVVFVGGFDPLQDWQRRYCEMLKRSRKEARLVEYPGGIHGFYALPEMPESTLFIAQLKDFIANQSTH